MAYAQYILTDTMPAMINEIQRTKQVVRDDQGRVAGVK